jgi:hypothetical protein
MHAWPSNSRDFSSLSLLQLRSLDHSNTAANWMQGIRRNRFMLWDYYAFVTLRRIYLTLEIHGVIRKQIGIGNLLTFKKIGKYFQNSLSAQIYFKQKIFLNLYTNS